MKNEKEQGILQQLTIEEKLQFTTGNGCWETHSVPRLGLSPVVMSDGPVGLRKEVAGETLPAVCFPSISKLACSFDVDTLREVGAAIGEQCRKENVDLLLAPGVNIKRNPRCGRNFEYFSEDPILTAGLATAYIEGVHSQEVGVCVKHFAGNSQEYGRRVCDSVIDDKALREIYLAAFERIVKNARPEAVMCAYNKLNGEYCCQNKKLLTDILRDEWQFDGLVMSDWGATDDRPKGIGAGLDLQMPQGEISSLRKLFNKGELNMDELNTAVSRVVKLALNVPPKEERDADYELQHQLAGKISADCTVLVKNHCKLLPFSNDGKVALIGKLAETPYFQGGGSSKVNPYKVESIKDGFEKNSVEFAYAAGYTLDDTEDEQLLEEARNLASSCDKVLLVVGNFGAETEGADRLSFSLPQNQLQVIDAVTSASSNVAIVLQCGAPVDVSWVSSCKALLIDYLSGENNSTLCDVVFGNVAPTGRLAETWPITLPQTDELYSADAKRALYTESIFVGYRYYTTANVEVAFPFGFGLNYSKFKWSNIQTSDDVVLPMGDFTVSLDVENCGDKADADTVQIYAENVETRDFHPKKTLVAFQKVRLEPGEKKTVTLTVNVSDFACYDLQKQSFVVNGGKYILTVANNCLDSGTQLAIHVEGANDTVDTTDTFACYHNVDEDFCPTAEQFEQLFGTFPDEPITPFSRNSSLLDIATTKTGKIIAKVLTKNAQDKRTLMALPLVDFVFVRKLSTEFVDILVDMLNGSRFKNLFRLAIYQIKAKIRAKKQK